MENYKVELKWGVIFAVAGLLWMFLEKSLGWHGEHIDKQATYTLFFFPIAILIYVLALIEKRKSLVGSMTWQQGFKAGLIIAFVVAIFSPVSQYLVHNVISPDYFGNVIKYSVDSGEMKQAEAEGFFNLKSYMIQAFIGAIIAGAVTSAVVSIFVKRA